MDESIRTNPLSYHSTMRFPRKNKKLRAGLESQPLPIWSNSQRTGLAGQAAPGNPSHPRALQRSWPCCSCRRGKGLLTWHSPSTLTIHSRARDTDPPDPPSFPCRPPCLMLAFRSWQPQPQSPCSKTKTLHPSMIHIMTTQAGTSYSFHPTASPCSLPPPQSPCSQPYLEESHLLGGQEGQRRARR